MPQPGSNTDEAPSNAPSSATTVALNSAWMTLDAVVGLAGGLAASIAIARVLGPQQLGYYSYLLWAMSAVAVAAALGLPAATRKYAAESFGAFSPPSARPGSRSGRALCAAPLSIRR